MALLATCLLSWLLPQEPATPAAPTPPPVPSIVSSLTPGGDVAQGNDDERAKMQAAERAGSKADAAVLTQLASSPNEKVAARAAFLLGRVDGEKATTALGEVVTASPHTSARTQAMAALLKRGDVTSVQAAIRGLEDQDLTVRTLAAQLLGKLRRPAAVDPLLALLERTRTEPPKTTTRRRNDEPKATDLQAALVALQDLGAKEHLLRAATALHEHPANGVGDALSYLFQNLSPKLDRKTEVTVLVAVLGHHEPLLRRYAIGRLGALAEPTTASALEGRLVNETELRPLVEVALSQVRHDPTAPTNDSVQKMLETAKGVAAQAKVRWNALPEQGRWIVAGSPVSLLVLFFVLGRWRRGRRDRQAADATMALVAPSDEHLQEMAAEAEALEAAANAEALAAHADAAANAEAPADDELVRS